MSLTHVNSNTSKASCNSQYELLTPDDVENSLGTLVSRISGDPAQLEDLMGLNMGLVYIAMFSLIGCITIAFVDGWKLTLVAMVAALPIPFTAGLNRLRFEVHFEEMNAKVFAESSRFAAEAFGAVRA
jgi:ABC-type multidrug transport system fused ATPase/permease subunit